ncbi:MAG: AI-2E family transporter [Pseudomonadota bacterium]
MKNILIEKTHKFWILVLCVALLFLWMFVDAIFPFLIAFIIAYLLTPATDRLEGLGMHRMIATNIAIFGFIAALILFGLLFIPLIIQQISDLITNLPVNLRKLVNFLTHQFGDTMETLPFTEKDLKKYISTYFNGGLENAAGYTKKAVEQIVSGSMSVVKTVASLIVTLVVAFYLVLDWHKLIKKIESWIPRHHLDTARCLFKEIDYLQSSFIRGQVLVCLIMAWYYIVVFEAIGLDYGFVLGLTTGILTFIPYVGASLGFIMTASIAAAQYLPEYSQLLILGVAFALGQTAEGYFLVPKLVGHAVHLHPAWIMFALLAFGSLFGIAGMLIAVPSITFMGVIVKFALERYMLSEYYNKDAKY